MSFKFENILQEIIWDKGNLKALGSYINDEPDQKYKIVVNKPFVFETTDESEYYTLRQILYQADADFEMSTEKI